MHRATQSETENSNAHRLGELGVERHQETLSELEQAAFWVGADPLRKGDCFPSAGHCWCPSADHCWRPRFLLHATCESSGLKVPMITGFQGSPTPYHRKTKLGFWKQEQTHPELSPPLATTTTPPRVGGLLRNFLVKFAKQISHKHKNQKTGDFKVPQKAEVLSYCHASLTFLPACQFACRGELHFKILHPYLFLALKTNKANMKCLGFSILMNSLEILKTREKYLSNSNGNQLTYNSFLWHTHKDRVEQGHFREVRSLLCTISQKLLGKWLS